MNFGKVTIMRRMWAIIAVASVPSLLFLSAIWAQTHDMDGFTLLAVSFISAPVSALIAFGTFFSAKTTAERTVDIIAIVFALLPVGYLLTLS
jgi:hypothetical protein